LALRACLHYRKAQKTADELLQSTLLQNEGDRAAFVRQACHGDEQLEREVLSLLAAGKQAGSFLEEPAIQFASPLLTSEASLDKTVGDGCATFL
jgi:hypothetical protein